MKSKFKYLGIVVVVILIYFNYYKEEEGIKEIATKIETIGVDYNLSGYEIKAGKQIDDIKLGISKFEDAIIKHGDMEIEAKDILLDSAKNIFLEKGIFGDNGEGWKFKAEKMSYNQLKDLLKSETGVKIFNEKDNIEIQSVNFRTNKNFSYINLNEKVIFKNESLKFKADKGIYTTANKIIILSGKVYIESIEESKVKIKGKFENGRFNNESKVLEIFGEFQMSYDGIILKGKKLWYNDLTKEFMINENPEIYLENENINSIYINKINSKIVSGNLEKMIFNFRENVTGQVTARDEKTTYNYEGKDLKVYLKRDKNGYKISEIKGKEEVTFSSENKVFISNSIHVNLNENLINGNGKNKLIFRDKKNQTILTGDKFFGNLKKDIFDVKGNTVLKNVSKGNTTTIIGESINLDNNKKIVEVKGNVKLENKELICTADRVVYNKKTNKAKAFGKVLVNYKIK